MRLPAVRFRLSKAYSFLLFAGLSYGLMGAFGCEACLRVIGFAKQPTVSPRITGTDGTSTGTASFSGNFTAITQPSQNYFLLQRQADCSLNLLTGTSTLGGSAKLTGTTPHYEAQLHRLASLTTAYGTYPKGCTESNAGVSTRIGVAVGKTQQGLLVFATAAGNGNNNAVWVLATNTTSNSGKFNPISSLVSASGLATADLNGDGNGDLLVVNSYGPTSAFVSVVLGNADGTFQAPISYATAGAKSVAAVIDDVNGDGRLDLVVASDDQKISVLTGKGDGTFNAAVSFAAALPGSTNPLSTPIVNLVTADLRGIGRKDIVGSNGLVLLGNGDGTFTSTTAAAFPYTIGSTIKGPNLASGDVNGDGKLDLVLNDGNIVTTWLGRADGTFTRGNGYAAINTTGFVTVSDLDGDGNLDIYTGLANGGYYSGDDDSPAAAYVLMGNGDGSFQGAPTSVGKYIGKNMGDFNGDGRSDLIGAGATSFNTQALPFTVQLGTAKGNFNPVSTIAPPTSFASGGRTYSTVGATVTTYAVGDMNRDGRADLVFVLTGVQTPDGLPFVFTALSNGDGTFATPVIQEFGSLAPTGSFNNSPTVDGMQIADFNQDGKADLVFTFTNQPIAPPPVSTSSVTQGFVVLLGNGDGTFGAPILTTVYSGATQPTYFIAAEVAAVTDLNGDGRLDLLSIARTGSASAGFGSQLQIYLGKGDGTFNAPTAVSTAVNPRVPSGASPSAPFVLVDLNGDGRIDLVCLGETSSSQAQVAVSLGNGNGTFGSPTILNVSGGDVIQSSGLALADFDGDGKVDMALLNPNSLSGIFYGKGDGTFTSVLNGTNAIPKDLINVAASGAAVAVDLNRDGKQDVLVGSTLLLNIYGSAPSTVVLANTTTALSASATTLTLGGSTTLTATIAPAPGSTGTPTGTVTFLDGTTPLGTGTLASGVATYTATALGLGAHSITAVYGGNTAFNGSTSPVVNVTVNAVPIVATATSLSASATGATVGTSIVFTGTVTPASGTAVPAGTVTFLDGTVTVGTGSLDGTGKAVFTTSALSVGSHSLTARYGGASTFGASTSNAVTVTIAAPVPDFSVAISPVSGLETKTSPVSAVLTVTPLNGFNSPVTFACSGLPTTVVCGFSPTTVTPAGAAATTTVTFSASATAMNQSQPKPAGGRAPILLAAFGLGAWMLRYGRRRAGVLRGVWALVLVAGLIGIAGCGGSSAPKVVTSTVTITATSGATVHTATYTLTSQ